MKYIDEINFFHDWLLTNQISTPSRILWFALMHYCNKTGWKDEFNVAISALELDTGLSRKTIERARNQLQQNGRISFTSRKGRLSAVYHIIPFVGHCDAQTDAQSVLQSVAQTDAQSVPIPRLDKDKTRLENKENNKKKTASFVKPTPEEIKSYCSERNNTVDADKFFDFYESKGWLIGKSHMKNWQAAVRTWEQHTGKTEKSKRRYDISC